MEEKYHHKEDFPVQFRFRRALCLLLMFFLMLSAMPATFAEDTADVAVQSAPLERSAATRNGMVRVRLLSIGSNPASLTVTAVGAMAVSGGQTMALANGEQISISHSSATGEIRLTRGGETVSMGREMALRRRQTDGGFRIAQARRPQNVYPGDLHLVSKLESGTYRLYVVANVYIESYLYGVVPYEMGSSSALEALKAQAVAARTYTLRAMNANASKVYDVVDTTADQVYNGSPAERDRAAEAVDATRGIVAMNDGKLTGTYYTASNGGQTESARNAWGSSGVNYLTVKDDPFDRMNPYSSTRKLTIYAAFSHASQNQTLTRLLQAKAPDATILRIEAVTPHTPKYAAPSRLYTKLDFDVTALVNGETRRLTLTFDIFSELESALNLSINTTKNELWSVKADGETFVLTVRRYGHGIGMSQRGAQQMANLGYTYDQILGFYYENCVRMQYTFTHTILPPVGDAPVTATEAPATISPAAPNQAMVTLVNVEDVLNVRLTSSDNGALLTTLPAGTAVTVLAKGDNWTLIRFGRIVGYVRTENLTFTGTPPTQSDENPTPITRWATVTGTNSLNLRASGSYDAAVQSTIPGGAVLCVFAVENGWASIQYGAKTGYCAAGYLTFSDTYPGKTSQTGRSAMVRTATALRATPSTAAVVLMNLPQGVQIAVQSSDGSWCRVTAGGIDGYVLASSLDFSAVGIELTPVPTTSGEQTAIVNSTASTLNLRQGAGTEYPVLAEIPKGTSIIVTAYGETWCAVRWGSLTGYVMTQYLRFDVPTATPTPGGTPTPSGTPTPGATPEPTASPEPSEAPTPVPAASEPPAKVEDDVSAGSYVAWVSADNAPLRQAMAADAAVLATIPRGTQVTVLAQDGGWCYAAVGQMTGYFTADALSCEQPDAPLGQKYVSTKSDSLAMRQSPNAGASIVQWLPRGALVTFISQENGWSYIRYGGKEGYCASQYLSDSAPGAVVISDTPILDVTLEKVTGWTASIRQAETLYQWCSADAPETAKVEADLVLTVLEKGEIWCRVRTEEGEEGYCLTSRLTLIAPEN